jgi:hypothetical protein
MQGLKALPEEQGEPGFTLGDITRYRYAAEWARPKDVVNDVACRRGFGASILVPIVERYHGYDEPGIIPPYMPGCFHEVDLDDPAWVPHEEADLTICFETLEYVKDPVQFAATLVAHTRRMLIVSACTVPAAHLDPARQFDFGIKSVPPLFAPLRMQACRAQPGDLTHVWRFVRDAS